MLIIAHRGASGYAPEHTFAAWDRALAMGADYLEQDLQMTRDGVLVVLHDDTLDRTARHAGQPLRGRVLDHVLAELADADVGSWFNDVRPELASPTFARERLPTLEAVLDRYAPLGAAFYIETKQPEAAPGMEEALLTLLDRFHLREPAALEWRVLIQSFSAASLQKLHAMDPRLPLIQLIEKGERDRRLEDIAAYAVGIGPHHSDVDAGLVAAAHARCLAVHPYTVNEPADAARLAAAGVDGVFTDLADRRLAERPPGEARGAAARREAAERWRRCRQLNAPAARSAALPR